MRIRVRSRSDSKLAMTAMEVGAAAAPPSLDISARTDERTASQLRPLECSRGLLTRAHGSATWSQENTTVMAAVYGPKPAAMRKENAERAVVEVTWRAKSGLPGSYEKEAEVVVRRSLEFIILTALHPNTAISVILQVISDDGSLLACAINAVCAALLDAGIPLNGLLTAVSCGVTHDGQVFLDPTKLEEQKSKAFVCLVFPSRPRSAVPELPADVDGEPVEHGILTSVTRGAMEVDEYFTCVENGRAATAKIAEFSRTGIERSQRSESGAIDQFGVWVEYDALKKTLKVFLHKVKANLTPKRQNANIAISYTGLDLAKEVKEFSYVGFGSRVPETPNGVYVIYDFVFTTKWALGSKVNK